MFQIAADSSCDRPSLPGIRVAYAPLTVTAGDRSFRDDAFLNIDEMLDYLASFHGRSCTACPSIDAWLQAFGESTEIFAVTITGGLSGSYNAACAAKELYLQTHPGARISVIDSLSTGPEMRLIIEKLAELDAQGISFEEADRIVRAYLTGTRLFFSLQSVHNLAQNGRVSKLAAAAVGALGIRIIATASPSGTIEQLNKCRGDKKALPELLEQIRSAGFPGTGKIRLTHVRNPELALRFANMLREAWPDSDIVLTPCSGLCSYYAEKGALLAAIET